EHRPRLTDYHTGCAFMVRADIIRRIGGFDLTYGLYTEDVDLSMKILQTGHKLWITPNAKVYHHVSASAGGELSPFKAFHRGRSAVLFVRRWARWWHLPTLFFGGLLGGMLISAKLILTGKSSTAGAIWRGIFCGFTGRKTPMEFRLGFPDQE
ncbi:MAG: glycosyltransferase family 2 protein, partial [Candidatus Electryoneaceae bacterium]|nr:glycosyltransferase family 2 protein [Candidatus Electryoneaceae bacterium]